MRKFKVTLSIAIACLLIAPLATHAAKINFPDILGYETLKCDFHTHTVFSDGQVWPTVRVNEAVREGLDAIAITDHIEYQPHKEDVPTNHGRSNEIASGLAEKRNILFPKGAEITRSTPPGHFNAIFLHVMFEASVKVTDTRRKSGRKIFLEIANNCDLNIELRRTGMVGPAEILLPAMDTTTLKIRVRRDVESIEISYVAENMLVAPNKGLPVKLIGSVK